MLAITLTRQVRFCQRQVSGLPDCGARLKLKSTLFSLRYSAVVVGSHPTRGPDATARCRGIHPAGSVRSLRALAVAFRGPSARRVPRCKVTPCTNPAWHEPCGPFFNHMGSESEELHRSHVVRAASTMACCVNGSTYSRDRCMETRRNASAVEARSRKVTDRSGSGRLERAAMAWLRFRARRGNELGATRGTLAEGVLPPS